jgi:hypothetical protein
MFTCHDVRHLLGWQLCHWICRLLGTPHFSCKAGATAHLSQVQEVDQVRVTREDAAYVYSLVSLNQNLTLIKLKLTLVWEYRAKQ